MEKEVAQKLKSLTQKEIELRTEFRRLRQELEALVDPITKHVKECNVFWRQNLNDADEIIAKFDNGLDLKIKRPSLEKAMVETYLPFGIDYTECKIIDVIDVK